MSTSEPISSDALAALVAQGLAALGDVRATAPPHVAPSPAPWTTHAPTHRLPVEHFPAGGIAPYTPIAPHTPIAPYTPRAQSFGSPVPLTAPTGLVPELAAAQSALPYFVDAQDVVSFVPGGAPGGARTEPRFEVPLTSPQRPTNDAYGGPLDVAALRRDFPLLSQRVHGRPLVWLDNAATTQKPRVVIDRLTTFYETENSNIHRAAHALAARATDAYEQARESVRRFLGARSTDDIVFVRGATEGLNLLAKSWGAKHVGAGDEIVLTHLEHHSNIVPWQMLADAVGATLRVIPVDDDGQIRIEEAERLIGPRTKVISTTHVSNALGTVVPVRELVRLAQRYGARVIVDGAQAVSHMPVDVLALGADFYVFSGHKVFGPTGIGAVYGRPEAWAETPPWQGGGNMIVDVTFGATKYADIPARFEAGTGNIADAVGLGVALDYLDRIGMHRVQAHEEALLAYGTARLREVEGLRLVGTAAEKAGVLSFVLDGFSPEEIGKALDHDGIAVRSGHHCAQPALRRFGHEATVRPSLALYNTRADLDCLLESLHRLRGAGPRQATHPRR